MAKDNQKDIANFKNTRAKELEKLYSDDLATRRRYDKGQKSYASTYTTASEVRTALQNALTDSDTVVEVSQQLYATNPIYAAIINYLRDMYAWKYRVVPHKIYSKSKKGRKSLKANDYSQLYELMLEVVEGLTLETKCPAILQKLFVEGSVYYTTLSDEDSLTIDTLLLPGEYCRKIGETQFGTSIINFDFSYFDSLGLSNDELKDYLASFPEEFTTGYNAYKKNATENQYGQLDPRFSSGILLNDQAIPTFLYTMGGILDFEKYQDNELERNENALRYLVVHTIPHYEDQLIFEVDEVAAIHRSLKKVVDTGDKARLITTYGDVHVEKIADSDTTANEVLSKAYTAIFNNAGFNSAIFTSESVEALKMSLIRDKGFVWRFVQEISNFYNLALNSWFDFGGYQADVEILPISSYTLNDDIEAYKANATLGVNKLDYFIASGIKQKHVADMLQLEQYLGLDQITPMQTSYTQTAEDRTDDSDESSTSNKETKTSDKSGIEPSDESKDKESSSDESLKEDQHEETTN